MSLTQNQSHSRSKDFGIRFGHFYATFGIFLIQRTSFSVKLDFGEEEGSFFSDELVSFKNISEVIFVHSLCVPLKSESTTNEGLISIESNESLIVSNIEWLTEKVHATIH